MKHLIGWVMAAILCAGATAEPLSEETATRIAEALERIADALEADADFSSPPAVVQNDASPVPRDYYICAGTFYAPRSRGAPWVMDSDARKKCESDVRQSCLLIGFDRFAILDKGGIEIEDETASPAIGEQSWIYECRNS